MTISSPWVRAVGDYLTYLRASGSPATTVATRRAHLYRTARDLGVNPWTIRPDDLLEWFAGQDWAAETRRGMRGTLRGFYRWGLETGRCRTNVALVLPVVKASRPNPRPVPDEAYRLALARAGHRERLMLRLSAEVGLRRAEVAKVHSRDLVEDLTGWSLVVVGKGNRERVLPLPEALAADLRRLPRGFAFPGQDEGHLSPRYVGVLVSRLLPEGWTMHKLRHRFASRAYAVDRDVFTVQDLLGHASPATTRHYVAVPNEALRRTVDAAVA